MIIFRLLSYLIIIESKSQSQAPFVLAISVSQTPFVLLSTVKCCYKYDNSENPKSSSSKVTISVSGTVAAAAYSFGLSARNPLVPEQGGHDSIGVC